MTAISFLGRAHATETAVLPAADGYGSAVTARQGRLSGRPSCRIFPVGKGWGLELERMSAWLVGLPLPGGFRFFKSLAAAVGFAEEHGLDYRIIRPSALSKIGRRRRPIFDGSRASGRTNFMRSSSS
ncbi:hypothetical protein [Hyphomicrobium sp.]|uniref:hypothetical protein n=1 Tax=Hyphomicrobium sp. TaxID=82 RepID=UPI002D78A88D|nr:hypothetical protein [Hyphomicrobium sp.]HET6390354.1 hypothetical protein [Hyphomicrobium sp.]